MMEEWRPIIDYPNYSINNFGIVRNDLNGKFPAIHSHVNNGYRQVCLKHSSGKFKTLRVCRLVGKAFLENPLNLEMIDHINHIITDDNITNLRWISRSNNVRHQRKRDTGSSRRIGVSYSVRENKWRAQIQINNKKFSSGYFKTEQEAFEAFKLLAINNGLGEFYNLN